MCNVPAMRLDAFAACSRVQKYEAGVGKIDNANAMSELGTVNVVLGLVLHGMEHRRVANKPAG